MRKNHLRQVANIYLLNRQGSYRTRMYRRYVIHKVINDLFVVKEIPPKWYALNQTQVQKLVIHWQKNKIKPATIMKYMTVLRWLLQNLNHCLIGIDNQSLGLFRTKSRSKNKPISPEILDKISDPIAHMLLALQLHFGLTVSEAMRFDPDTFSLNNRLWITRDIASNSKDRIIPIRTKEQRIIIEKMISLTGTLENLIATLGYDVVRYNYRKAMKSLRLSSKKSYRYVYAQMTYEQLLPALGKPACLAMIMQEMGLESRVTLWGYLKSFRPKQYIQQEEVTQ